MTTLGKRAMALGSMILQHGKSDLKSIALQVFDLFPYWENAEKLKMELGRFALSEHIAFITHV